MKNIVSVLVLILFVYACKPGKQEKVLNEKEKDSLNSRLSSLSDSVDFIWARMEQNDDSIFFCVNRLGKELNYSGNNAAIEYSMKNWVNQTQSKKYSKETVKVSSNIDLYDAGMDSLLNKTRKGALNTKEFGKLPFAETLLSDIARYQQNIFLLRVRHDQFALEYNNILKDYIGRLNEGRKDSLKLKGVFQIQS